jgi:hypothetical protein
MQRIFNTATTPSPTNIQVVDALREFNRVLIPEGLLLLAFHVGSEVVHRDEMWGQAVSLDFISSSSSSRAARDGRLRPGGGL